MKTILVVDDNPTNIGLLFDCLKHEGFKTLIAQDGKSALGMAKRMRPDLILLDVIMPEMDGFETCRALKEQPETTEIPVFFMTALSDTKSKVKGFECGAVDFISKPFQQEEVLARIHTHLVIQEQKQALLVANHIKERVISVVAHDLRNPFTAIFAYLQRLSERYDHLDDTKRKALVEKLMNANKDLFNLVESLMDWISTGEGKLAFHPTTVPLKALITSVCQASRALAEKKFIQLTTDVDDAVQVTADKDMLGSVLRNLLTNALKFTAKSGSVTICTTRSHHSVIISVKDTGMGMDRTTLDRVLNGNKLHSTPGTDKEGGSGMGLVICLEFIHVMGGELTVESTPGKGSTFNVALAAAPREDGA